MTAVWGALAAASLALAVHGQASLPPPSPVVTLDYSNDGISPKHWILTIHPDGAGHFRSQRGKGPISVSQSIDAADIDRDIQVSPRFAASVFDSARRRKWFNMECESHIKVAFQGWKTLAYQGPDGSGSCVFNYSKDKDVQTLGDSLVSVASTLEEGARLETLLQHDRLGLDKEMEFLTSAAADGRAQQVCVIRSILERLADDSAVMDRVRKRARLLLAQSCK